MIYENILRPILFRFTDAEKIHHQVANGLRMVSNNKFCFNKISSALVTKDKRLETKIGSLTLPSPVGLAAGFDKTVTAPLAYPMLGFGFAEIGSITYEEQTGNLKPRLWRIPKDKGLIVFSGLPNLGALKTVDKLSLLINRPIPYGVSIAPTNKVDFDKTADDYIRTLDLIHPFADYITLNTSCPNVAKHDHFAQISFMEELIEKARNLMVEKKINKDIFIKIGPHHTENDLHRIAKACLKHSFTGIIATNLIKIRDGVEFKSSEAELSHPGGISGGKLQAESDSTIRRVYFESEGKLKIIGVGGIFSADDAYRKIKLGASAIQLITGFIYGGPLIIKRINDGLVELLNRDGYNNISEVVGKI